MNRRIKRDVETGVEYILPDYMGDIKKVLMYRSECTPCDCYLSDNNLEITGGVDYVVIYADAENKLSSINVSSDLSLSLPAAQDGYVGADVYTNVENVSLRVTGPRKLSIKSGVNVAVVLTEEGSLDVAGDAMEEGRQPETSVAVINAENSRYIENKVEREIAEELERIPGLSGEDVEIIGSGGTVKIDEVSVVDGGVEIKGEIIVAVIVKTALQPPFRIVKSIPLNELIEIDATGDEQIYPTAYISSLGFGENDDGEDKIIVANAIVEFEINLKSNVPTTVVKDAYLLEYECENSYSELEYNTLLSRQVEGCLANASLELGELGCDKIHSILSSNADIKDLSVQNDNGSVKIFANIAFSGIACEINADESITYYSIKKNIPFEKNVNISCQNIENAVFYPRIRNKVTNALIDGEKIALECHFDVDIDILGRGKITCLCSSNITGDIQAPTRSVINVYYPSIGDTLFDIAKRYHTTAAKLCEDNSIAAPASLDDSSVLQDIKRLIIK